MLRSTRCPLIFFRINHNQFVFGLDVYQNLTRDRVILSVPDFAAHNRRAVGTHKNEVKLISIAQICGLRWSHPFKNRDKKT